MNSIMELAEDTLGRNPDWRVVMANYVCTYVKDFTIEHRRGIKHVNVDALSTKATQTGAKHKGVTQYWRR